jgi:ATP phosphoribosyltransferase regulatory subunit
MDNASQMMMGLRADITPQIERIATTLLASGQSVTRLSYVGQVLRVSPAGMSTARQLRQAGMEMIGAADQVSELEVLTAAIEGLESLGLESIVLGLSYGGLFEALFSGCLADSQAIIRKALYHKDVGSLPEAMPFKDITIALLTESCENVLMRDDIPAAIKPSLLAMQQIQHALQERFPTLIIRPDPLDTEGFDYHEGLCFTLFDAPSRQEIGRGGCYTLSEVQRGCGVTFYIERLIAASITPPVALPYQNIDAQMPYAEAKKLRDEGIVTLTRNN